MLSYPRTVFLGVAPCFALQVIPLYCFDPRQFCMTPNGYPKTGAFRAKFLLESVLALRSALRNLGSDLLIANGQPEDVLQGVPSTPADGCPEAPPLPCLTPDPAQAR